LWVKELAEDCVMACVDNRGTDSKWEQILMIFNCSDRSAYADLPHGSWQVLADGENALRWQKDNTVSGEIIAPEFSALILGMK